MNKSVSKGDLSALAKEPKKPLFPSSKGLGNLGGKTPLIGNKTGISLGKTENKEQNKQENKKEETKIPLNPKPQPSSISSKPPAFPKPQNQNTFKPKNSPASVPSSSPAVQPAQSPSTTPPAVPLAMKTKPSSQAADFSATPKTFAEMILFIDKKLSKKSQEYDEWSAELDSKEKQLDELEIQVQKKEDEFQAKIASSEKELQILRDEISKIEDKLMQLPQKTSDSEQKRSETLYEIDLKANNLIQKIEKRGQIFKNVYETHIDILNFKQQKAEQKK